MNTSQDIIIEEKYEEGMNTWQDIVIEEKYFTMNEPIIVINDTFNIIRMVFTHASPDLSPTTSATFLLVGSSQQSSFWW